MKRAVQLVGTCIDRAVVPAVQWVCGLLMVAMILITVYTVFMRFVFDNPPFWGDTVSLFCNIWLVLLGYGISARRREYIAMQGLYAILPSGFGAALNVFWDLVTGCFGVFLAWYGMVAALTVPGEFWELGGLPMEVPMMIMPIAGTGLAVLTLHNVWSDLTRLMGRPEEEGRLGNKGADPHVTGGAG